MTRLQAHFELPRLIDHSWPIERMVGDPWAQEEALLDPAPASDYHRHAARPELNDSEVLAWDQTFLRLYRQILAGQAPWSAIRPAARALQVDLPLQHDPRPAHPAMAPLADSALADMAESWGQSLGLMAFERNLGPFAMGPLPRPVQVACYVNLGCAPLMHPGVRPLGRAIRSEPVPPLEIRSAVLAVLRAPAMLWIRQGNGFSPMLPLSPTATPPAGAWGPLPGGLSEGVLASAPYFLGRAARHAGGWWMAAAIPLPVAPDTRILLRRLRLEYWRLRRQDRRLTWEDLLRERGELLYRTTCEALFSTPSLASPVISSSEVACGAAAVLATWSTCSPAGP